ncbi:MAG TPA: UDP-N-acetylmuramate--L-alanine ligase [Patescibacteria group bacterium]|nr:UDP-N-acetylmuramate--L-alanine ligase [Patescibacteria group bacterium]
MNVDELNSDMSSSFGGDPAHKSGEDVIKMDFNKIKKVHLTGIKGVGMTAMALYLQDIGINISGSDVSEVFVTDEILKKRNIKWLTGLSDKNVDKDTDLLITTAAHGGLGNVEVEYAKKKGIPVMTYAEVLAQAAGEKETIGVCGVGGKTSISSILSVVLDTAGMKPSFIVGVGNIYPLGVPGKYEKDGRNFICEADDYVISPGIDNRPKFSLLTPKIVIATNIEYDHPDIYENFEKTKEVFTQFFQKIPKFGHLIANADNANTMSVAKNFRNNLVTYGFEDSVDYRIQKLKFENQKSIFSIYNKKKKKVIENIRINLPGKFNVENATAAYVAGDLLGIDEISLKSGLERYLGCRRRFEDMGMFFGGKFFDDYAHHPGEIVATLKAAKDWFPKRRLVAVFQPHTYSRTKALFDDFARSFSEANLVALMDIYSSAREKFDPGISSEELAKKTKTFNKNCFYVGDHKMTVKWMEENIKSGDVVITMGAGDIFHIYNDLKSISVK